MKIQAIRSTRLELRPLAQTDRSSVDTLYGDVRVTSGFGMAAFSPSQLDAKMDQLIGSWTQGGFSQFLVIEREQESVTGLGGIRPTSTPNVGEIGYVFSPDWWGKGIASEAIELWVKWGFEELELAAIVAIGVENPASVRVLEKAGFLVTDDDGQLKNLQIIRGISTD